MRKFALYPVALHWWSFADHLFVLETVERLRPARVLEFGPGSSTLALIEGGATTIDTCEDDPHYFDVYRERFAKSHPGIVHVHPYRWNPVPRILGVHSKHYDLALIDGPRETVQRGATLVYAMERCERVLVPLEEMPGEKTGCMRELVHRFAAFFRRDFEVTEDTGPLAGSFALIGPPC